MKIGPIDLDAEVMLIAEIGNNHEGDPGAALSLAEAAVRAGAHAVKVQVIDPRRLVAENQVERIRQLDRYRLSMEQFAAVGERVRALGALFMASAFDVDSLHAIAPQLDAVKVASGDLDFHPLLRAAVRTGKPVILSTGMATLAEIDAAVAAARVAIPAGQDLASRLALLHCVSLYPTEPRQANLSAIGTLARRYELTTGYSDHTLGVEVAALSLGLGARIIEKHFTLDKSRTSFRDHALSADAAELARLAALVRHAREILGDGERGEGIADRASAAGARRSIVAARELPRGHRLAETDLDFLRPGTGLSPASAGRLVGRTLRRALRRQDPVNLDDVE